MRLHHLQIVWWEEPLMAKKFALNRKKIKARVRIWILGAFIFKQGKLAGIRAETKLKIGNKVIKLQKRGMMKNAIFYPKANFIDPVYFSPEKFVHFRLF
jgi:hypothetical protein